jgi:hypothetical protein
LIVRGEKDAWVDGAVSQKLAADITDCRVVSLPDAARLVPEEMPDELASLVISFVSPHVGRKASELLIGGETDAPDSVPEDVGTSEGGSA